MDAFNGLLHGFEIALMPATLIAAIMGGIAAYALPIAYSLLGAFAFRLRLFADSIRRRTYHPSFADSARMITAVIAGAIVGGLMIGASEKVAEVYLGPLIGGGIENWFPYVLALLFLLVRPDGLFGEKRIERV